MSAEKDLKDFNAGTVALEGSNLIEASAGTGKTYSIAILVLRLLLEKELQIREILMVTFTKAAVAELEERIRLFVRMAYRAAEGGQVTDSTIERLVDESCGQKGQERVVSLLKDAVLFLDDTSVLTIHSFCQLTLSEFAFETRQLFGAETLQDTQSLLADEVNQFWRQEVTTLPVPLLESLLAAGFSRSSLSAAVKEHLDGKRYFGYDEKEDYKLCPDDHAAFIRDITAFRERETALRGRLRTYIQNNGDELRTLSQSDRYARKAFLDLVDDPESFIEALRSKRSSAYVGKLFGHLLEQCDECDNVSKELESLARKVIARLHCHAISVISVAMASYKRRYNQIAFDDMILNLHAALTERDSSVLVEKLRAKYKAVFVDEFQDTDRLQYEIFDEAFGQETILFYIGDPKQSIYAWRKADIFTYFKAAAGVQHRYGMNENFRSSESFISAMNAFFEPQENFDTFHFAGAAHAIRYIPVKSPLPNRKGLLYRGTLPVTPLTIFEVGKKETVYEGLAAQVIELLRDTSYRIGEQENGRQIKASDIGILVRTNGEGRLVKNALTRYHLPAVTIGDDKVLQSDEALALLYLLEAIVNISRQNINRALLSPFTGYSSDQILAIDDVKALELFGKYKKAWDENGVYTALMSFVVDFSVRKVLLNPQTENGERIITNLYQLIELLHKVQTRNKLSPPELISWLRRGIDGMETQGDEYEQRVESDEEAIRIVTIHKSKGLEYKIVLAPFLDFTINRNTPFCSFRDAETGEYVSAAREELTEEQVRLIEEQQEQENRRLLYVAITRAVYKCFVFRISSSYYNGSTLSHFVNALASGTDAQQNIEFSEPPAIPANGYSYMPAWSSLAEGTGEKPEPVRFDLPEANWRKMSYTMLSPEHAASVAFRASQGRDPYGRFIYNELPRGAKTGNLLHYIFENAHFGNPQSWPHVIEDAVRRFSPQQQETYPAMLAQMLDHVLYTQIEMGQEAFSLSQVPQRNQLHEFEFDFQVPLFSAPLLEDLSDSNIQVHVGKHSELQGIMNGKMDLFFAMGDKYYILDWKSNYLGDTDDDYSASSVAAAMNENNYHLQYLIYTVAAKKYLESRLRSFDYETQFGGVMYFFVRGIRRDSSNGIFRSIPPLEKIERLERLLSGKTTMGTAQRLA